MTTEQKVEYFLAQGTDIRELKQFLQEITYFVGCNWITLFLGKCYLFLGKLTHFSIVFRNQTKICNVSFFRQISTHYPCNELKFTGKNHLSKEA